MSKKELLKKKAGLLSQMKLLGWTTLILPGTAIPHAKKIADIIKQVKAIDTQIISINKEQTRANKAEHDKRKQETIKKLEQLNAIKEQKKAAEKARKEAKKNSPEEIAKREERKAIRKEGLNELKEGFRDWWNIGSQQAASAAQGAAEAFGLGDKKSMIKGAIEGANIGENFMKNIRAHGKMIKGAGKVIFNDLKWYNNYPDAAIEMIGPNFNRRLGCAEPLLDQNINGSYIPSITTSARVRVHLTHGDDSNGAVTAAITRLYTAIRQANAGAVNWNTIDLDGYLFNARVIIMMYNCACRILRELNKYSIINKGVPYANFAAMGVDYDTFSDNAANLRNFLITLRTRLKCLALPKLDIISRTDWLFKNSFWDSNDAKHQTYYITPTDTVGFWNAGASTPVWGTAALLSTPTSAATGQTYSNFMTAIKTITASILGYDKYSIISGDIVKAYGPESLYHLDEVPGVNDLPLEGYSEEVLTQIQNAYNPGSHYNRTGYAVSLATSLNGVILAQNAGWQQSVNTPTTVQLGSTFVNMYKNNISNLDVLAATRLTCFGKSVASGTYANVGFGTELFDGINYYYYNYKSSPNKYNVDYQIGYSYDQVNASSMATVEQMAVKLQAWSHVDWSPRITNFVTYYASGQSSSTTTIGPMLWDFNNYALLDSIETLTSIHDIATASLYYTPLMVRNTNVVTY